MNNTLATLIDEEARRRFEAGWRKGEPEPIERFLPPGEHPLYLATLLELVLIEQEFAWMAQPRRDRDAPPAQRPAWVEDYLRRFPALQQPSLVLQLLKQEYRVRLKSGDAVHGSEYQKRFPELAHSNQELEPTVPIFATEKKLLSDIPGYEILEELGHGSMGVVFKALQKSLNRIVALKLIQASVGGSGEHRARFRTEAEALAQLHHPGIVQIHEIGEHDGMPYLALEFVEGGNLAGQLRNTPLPPREAAGLVESVALAMQAAHERGILHRDLKPANILLRTKSASRKPQAEFVSDCGIRISDFEPKVTDFGLAKRLDQASDQTRSGVIVGTPSYMAPEQAAGKTKDIGPAADVYALGAILYELLTTRPPFRAATTLDTLHQVIHDEPVAPMRLQPALPRDLDTICLKCLAKEPARRYHSAQALAEDLRRFLAGQPILARPVSQLERLVKWARRNRAAAALMVTVTLSLLLGIIGTTLFGVYASRTSVAEAKARQRTERLLYFSKIQLAQQAWQIGQVPTALTHLDQCRADLRGWEFDYLRRLCQGTPRTFHGHTRAVNSVAFTHNGKRIVSGGEDGTVKVWDADTGAVIFTLTGHNGPVHSVTVSADGKRIASGSNGNTIKIWDAETGRETFSIQPPGGDVMNVAISPNGQRVASGSLGKTVKVWDVATGVEVLTLKGHSDSLTSVAFDAAGKRIVSGCGWFGGTGEVKLWDAVTGQELLTLKGDGNDAQTVIISADGKRIAKTSTSGQVIVWNAANGQEILRIREFGLALAFSADGANIVGANEPDHTLKLWSVDANQQVRTFKGHTERVLSLACSSDGKRLVSGSADKTIKVWDVDAGTWDASVALAGISRPVRSVGISANGKRIVSGGGDVSGISIRLKEAATENQLLVWDGETGRRLFALQGHSRPVRGVSITADGTRIASGSEDKTIKLWDANTGQELLTLKGHAETVRSVAFSPDGRRLASAGHDNAVKIWDASTGAELVTLQGHTEWVTSVAFRADGRRLASGSDDHTARVWDVATGQELLTLAGHAESVRGLDFSPDGLRIVSGSDDKTIKVWDANEGRELLTVNGHFNVWSIGFSPDGQPLVSGGSDRAVRVWDAATGQEALSLHGHGGAVSSVTFSRDGRQIISGGLDGAVKVWDAGKTVTAKHDRH